MQTTSQPCWSAALWQDSRLGMLHFLPASVLRTDEYISVLSMTVPLYNVSVTFIPIVCENPHDGTQTEIAPPKNRGFIVGLTQQMVGIGFIVANWVGYGCQFLLGNSQWRLPLGLQVWSTRSSSSTLPSSTSSSTFRPHSSSLLAAPSPRWLRIDLEIHLEQQRSVLHTSR